MQLHELLAFERPIIFFDCETTGPNPASDRIVSLGFIQLKPADGTQREWHSLVNPGMPIPHEATYGNGANYPGHGITDAMVADAPRFAQLAPSLLKGFHDCDYGGYNIKGFDLPLMQAEFARNGHVWSWDNARIVDAYRLWQLGEARTLSDARQRFLGENHDGAHKAVDDVRVTLRVVAEMLTIWDKLPRDIQALHTLAYPVAPNAVDAEGKIIWGENGTAIINFGKKYKGQALADMKARDLLWLANQATGLNDDVRTICRDAAMGKFPNKELS